MVQKILYVDDDAAMLELVRVLLEREGYELLTANNVDEALRLTKGASLGLMVIDVNLAGDSGLMLMNFMAYNFKGAPVILYSGGERDETTVAKMLARGATRYVQKSNGKELVKAVKELLPLR